MVLAATLATAGRDAEAVPEAREALRIDPEHKSALVMLGFGLARSGQYAEAIPVLGKALLASVNLPLIHKHLGGCLVHTRDFDGAVPTVRREQGRRLQPAPRRASAPDRAGRTGAARSS